MKKNIEITCCLLGSLLATTLGAEPVKLPPREKFHLFLLAGQSNMAGRGIIQQEDRRPYSRVLMFDKNGQWVPAHAPIHFDKTSAGIGPGDNFAKLLAASDPSITIGLIPTACGGSSILHWQPGAYWKGTNSHPYDDALTRTHKALATGKLQAILWHQGESDCNMDTAEQYEQKLTALIRNFRKKFNAGNVPVLIGQLSQFPGETWSPAKSKIDVAHRNTVANCQPAAFITSEGLTSNPDKIHFDRASQIELGKRYYEAYCQLLRKNGKK